MEQNENQENQYEEIDRRKAAFLIGGILVILAALMLIIFLFTDRTKASTGEGNAIRITPDRIERISDDVSEQVLNKLSTEILADRIQEAVQKELSKDRIYEILSDGDIQVVAVGEEELKDIIAVLLADLGMNGDGMLTEEQKKYIRLAVKEALEDALEQVSVAQPLTEEEKRQLEERLKQELSETLKNQLQNSTYELTGPELEKLKKSLHIESLITGAVEKISKQQLDKLKTNLISELKKSVKTPVKGKDYFTEADIKSIQETVLKAANKELLKQIESLTGKINEVKTSVNTLAKQVKELQTLDKQKSADIKKLQESVSNINKSIQNINVVTKLLTEAVTITGSHLEKATGSGSEVQSSAVPTADMTIAEFVDILAGNDQVYTRAIQELNKIIKQLKDENTKQDENFDKTVKELENSLADNGKDLEEARAELEKSDQALKEEIAKSGQEFQKQLDDQSSDIGKQLEEERKERESADKKLQEQADAADKLTGDPKEAGPVEGDTIFQKLGAIVRILSKDGLSGLLEALQGIGGAQTVEEGIENLHTDLSDARARVAELEKEKWLSNLTLLAEQQEEGAVGYAYQESGSAYVYQIPLVTDEDQIDLSMDDTSIVVQFKRPDRLPSNVALSTSGNTLLISFTNRPSRNIHITSIHVYKEK